MHMIARREEDRLLFDNQRKLAEIWQMVDGETLAVEQFMQVYYRWTHALAQLTELLLECFDQQILHADDVEPAEQLSEDFELSRGQLVARHRGVFTRTTVQLTPSFSYHCQQSTYPWYCPRNLAFSPRIGAVDRRHVSL